MFVDTMSAEWRTVGPVLIVVGGLMRLLFFIKRRKDPQYHAWQPAEIIALRSIVLIITGKPMTPITWKRLDALLLVILLLAVAAGVRNNARDNARYRPTSHHSVTRSSNSAN
jgi:hypothetical protein